jgi:carboxylesterase type B
MPPLPYVAVPEATTYTRRAIFNAQADVEARRAMARAQEEEGVSSRTYARELRVARRKEAQALKRQERERLLEEEAANIEPTKGKKKKKPKQKKRGE